MDYLREIGSNKIVLIFRINSNSKLRPNQFWDSFRTTNCVVNHETEHVKQISKQTTIFRADNSDCHFILFCNLKLYCNWDLGTILIAIKVKHGAKSSYGDKIFASTNWTLIMFFFQMKCALNLKESTAGQIMFRDVIETEIESSKLFILELKSQVLSQWSKKLFEKLQSLTGLCLYVIAQEVDL